MSERKMQIRLKSVFTLDKNTGLGADITDQKNYLYKNGKMCYCPFRAIAMQKSETEIIWLSPKCGEYCQHFHIVPEKKKITKPNENAGTTSDMSLKEEIIETGKINVTLTCGSTVTLPIANLDLKGGVQEASPLTVEKKP